MDDADVGMLGVFLAMGFVLLIIIAIGANTQM
jgi:hypothetical protein